MTSEKCVSAVRGVFSKHYVCAAFSININSSYAILKNCVFGRCVHILMSKSRFTVVRVSAPVSYYLLISANISFYM